MAAFGRVVQLGEIFQMNSKEPLTQIELTGKYVQLVPLAMVHAQELVDVANESRKTFGLTGVPSDLDSAEKYIQRAIDLYQDRTALPFAILERRTNKIVGTTRFLNVEFWDYPVRHELHRPSHLPHAVEIGATWLGESHQRTGINTDAKLCLLKHAFEEWRVLRVSLKTDARNARSRANIERLGARFDGVVRANMPSFDGGVRDTAFYSILISEWPGLKELLQAKLR